MKRGAVEAVRRIRTAGAAGLRPAGRRRAEHEVVDDELRAPVEELGQRLAPLVRVELVLLLDRHPGELLPPARKLVAAPRQLLLLGEERGPGLQPLVAGADPAHCCISIDGAPPGSVNPGTLPEAKATQPPSTTRATATRRESLGPCGSTFSAKIATATTPIQTRLITPSANSTTIRPPEQPTQSRPCATPAPNGLGSSCGLRHRRSERCFIGVSS